MLSRGKVTPATVSYYSDEVAQGAEDYYLGRGEAAGAWLGRGSASAGLAGEVSPEGLARLFEARHPSTGEPLGRRYRVRAGADRVTGWDLTFSSPKSVSTLWAVGGGAVGMEVREAHDAAVTAALAFVEDHGAFSRTGKAGVRQVDTDGVVAAGFVHRTSRAGDPQLHTHVLVSGRVRCSDDQVWRALDSKGLHRHLKPAGMVYQAALRAELAERLGVAWTTVDRHGQAEVDGVPVGLRKRFARRRAAVETRAAERMAEAEGRKGRRLTAAERRRVHEVAVLETRRAKDHGPESDVGLHDRWLVEAEAAGFAPADWLDATLGRDRPLAEDPEQVVAEVVRAAVAELAASSSTWRRADVVRQVARRAPAAGGAEATRRWIEAVAERVLVAPGVVALTVPAPQAPDELRRRDGMCVFDCHGATRYSTLATLATEQAVLDVAEAGADAGRGVATLNATEAAIEAAGLGPDQAAAVRVVCREGDAVICVVGPAGAGKSRTMGAAADAWGRAGMSVRGLAVSAVAAGVLQSESGIASDTVAKLLFEHDRPGGADVRWRLRPGSVVVVDEAGMLASADLARLVRLADAAEAKIVLVGDYAQLGAVEAGGLFRLLVEDHSVELDGVRRFSAPWEAEASLRLRARDPAVLNDYDAHGRIHAHDRLGAIDAAVAAWHQARAAGASAVVCAPDHASADEIARRIRAARVAAGEVEATGVAVGEDMVGVGDEIVTARNDRRLMTTAGAWVRNGDRWAVTARHGDGSLSVSSLTGRGRVTLPGDYVADEVALAYALTLHKAQGVTVDRAVVVADDAISAEALYVGMTRGRHDNTVLVVCDDLDEEHRAEPRTALEVLTGALGHVSAEQAALGVLRAELEASESLAVLVPRLANLDFELRRGTPPDPSDELRLVEGRRFRLESTARPGRLTRAGRDDRRALAALDQRRAQLEADAERRRSWLAEHAGSFAYRDELATQVAARRAALRVNALVTQPAHLVELLGPVPADDVGEERWASRAGRIEAYREQWGVAPDRLRAPPADGVQYQEWSVVIHTFDLLDRLQAQAIERGQQPGLERGHGIEL